MGWAIAFIWLAAGVIAATIAAGDLAKIETPRRWFYIAGILLLGPVALTLVGNR